MLLAIDIGNTNIVMGCIKNDEILHLLAQFLEGVAIAVAGCDLLYVCHITCPPVR